MSAHAATFSPFNYIECDIPEGMTLGSWRAARDERDAGMSPMSGVLRRMRRVRRARQRREVR
jgi:hypothetical protein